MPEASLPSFGNSADTPSTDQILEKDLASATINITVGQRMLAACSGSLLTSLVVTPFDVVRVRLHQQHATISALSALSTTPTISQSMVHSTIPLRPNGGTRGAMEFVAHKMHPINVTNIPPGVGITSCCKEIFWFPSSIDYCIAHSLDSCAVEDASRKNFEGTWEGLRKIQQNEGAGALWRGVSLTLLMAIPSNVIYFTGYEFMRDRSPFSQTHQVLNPLICGSLARMLSATIVSPIELFRTRMQSTTSSNAKTSAFNNTMIGIRQMVVEKGVFSLWRGLVLTLWRDVPFSGIYWASYEFLKSSMDELSYFSTNPDDTFVKSFIGGSISGTIASIFTNPFDVGKTRRQVGHHSSTHNKLGMVSFLSKIIKDEGFGALYVGLMPRILKIAPSCAIMISSYEIGKKVFHEMNNKNETLEL
ncbi:mitochondrial carrier [Nadsonia fulvescens var. elongata DSM 6958]|uniref:Mitochondrial carrier n=1 Tax=Nadsonia fulvescens var. elongata DSM 6958 TaxID=857566 RepID=A0A1E3PS97_9ASCO|nr:mitochondrial carrier [Nadsonia fulvescens var. elongata DSM 6958]